MDSGGTDRCGRPSAQDSRLWPVAEHSHTMQGMKELWAAYDAWEEQHRAAYSGPWVATVTEGRQPSTRARTGPQDDTQGGLADPWQPC